MNSMNEDRIKNLTTVLKKLNEGVTEENHPFLA